MCIDYKVQPTISATVAATVSATVAISTTAFITTAAGITRISLRATDHITKLGLVSES